MKEGDYVRSQIGDHSSEGVRIISIDDDMARVRTMRPKKEGMSDIEYDIPVKFLFKRMVPDDD